MTSADLLGRRVLITGGASGIGRATVLRLVQAGAHVVVVDVDQVGASTLSIEADGAVGTVHVVTADVSREEDVRQAVDTAVAVLGGLDVLIHAAGVMSGQLLDIREFDESTWDQVVDINLKGAFFAAKHAARAMLPEGRGVIILIASKAGVSTGSGSFAYGSSKGGVHGLAMTLERHLGPKGIRVNDVCPGDIDTPLYRRSLEEALRHGADPGVINRAISDLTPPAAVADVVAFLVSDAAACVRGTIFTT